jgi:hypothetical protein
MMAAREGAPTFKGRALRQLHPIVRPHAVSNPESAYVVLCCE